MFLKCYDVVSKDYGRENSNEPFPSSHTFLLLHEGDGEHLRLWSILLRNLKILKGTILVRGALTSGGKDV